MRKQMRIAIDHLSTAREWQSQGASGGRPGSRAQLPWCLPRSQQDFPLRLIAAVDPPTIVFIALEATSFTSCYVLSLQTI